MSSPIDELERLCDVINAGTMAPQDQIKIIKDVIAAVKGVPSSNIAPTVKPKPFVFIPKDVSDRMAREREAEKAKVKVVIAQTLIPRQFADYSDTEDAYIYLVGIAHSYANKEELDKAEKNGHPDMDIKFKRFLGMHGGWKFDGERSDMENRWEDLTLPVGTDHIILDHDGVKHKQLPSVAHIPMRSEEELARIRAKHNRLGTLRLMGSS